MDANWLSVDSLPVPKWDCLQGGDADDAADAMVGAGAGRLLRIPLHCIPGLATPELGGRNPAWPGHVHARRNESHDKNAGAVARVRGDRAGLTQQQPIDVFSEADQQRPLVILWDESLNGSGAAITLRSVHTLECGDHDC